VRAKDCIVIDDKLPADQAACLSVNPFTAYAMVQLAKEHASKTIIQNAAAGQLGKFINALAELEGIKVINIVRKEEHLKESNYAYVLWSQQEDFREKLENLATSMNANIAFDAVGGEQSGYILAAMPGNSTLYLYGALGASTLSEIPASDVIFRKKSIQGFNMNEWKENLSNEEFTKLAREIQSLIIQGKIKTEVQASFPLAEFDKGLMQYIRAMSAGKVLSKP
jgi:NADPH:quinone reductase-like Zn-dependent oxidoreductase